MSIADVLPENNATEDFNKTVTLLQHNPNETIKLGPQMSMQKRKIIKMKNMPASSIRGS